MAAKHLREILREARAESGPHLRKRLPALLADQPKGIADHIARSYGIGPDQAEKPESTK